MIASRRPRVLAVLPNYMAARNFLAAGVASALSAASELTCVLSRVLQDRLAGSIPSETRIVEPPACSRWRTRLKAARTVLWPGLGFAGLAFRFNEMHGFAAHRLKVSLDAERQAREALAGNFVASRYGWPWPRSRATYRALRQLYWRPRSLDPAVKAMIDGIGPDVAYLAQAQLPGQRDLILAAARRGVSLVGNIASWDQPTTKGPVPPLLDRYLVQGSWMKDCLVAHHGITPAKIEITGWPQMDAYGEAGGRQVLATCRARLGIPADSLVILFGLYSPRLGGHEPAAARALLVEIERRPELNWHLLIRPHPRAVDFLNAFDDLRCSPQVSFVTERLDDLRQLRDQIRLASAVVSSFGSLALDAVALDRPAFYLSNGEESPWTQMEHIASVVNTGAVPVASSIPVLVRMLVRNLGEPEHLASERARLRALHLGLLDGKAGERVAAAILRAADGRA